MDQIFVALKHWLLGQLATILPAWLLPVVSALMSIAAIIGVFATLFAIMTILERKGLGRIQNRYGPNRVGPFGFLQPAADGIKAIIKEDVVPRAADKVVHFLAPVVLVIPALLVYSVLPIGRNMVAIDLDAGLLFFFAVGAASELAVFMAGWSSRNKYALLGAMRAVAQMVSYEIPLILSTISVVMITGTLSPVKIVEAQSTHAGLLPDWFVFTPWGFAGFILFMISANAEANRSPFDLPEGESELVAGYFTEYSGFKFALFFLAEYLGLFAVSGLGITLFLGGWNSPFAALDFVPSWAWFFAKLLGLIVLFIWTRGTLPRLRVDQLMNFAWKFMIPMVLINLVAAAAWHYVGGGFARWFVSGAIVLGSYLLLGRGLFHGKGITKRTYRYAE
ncbi:MAG: NADH-quinone oxidoreductase subunit NuoH [Verrucomicrobia bacterium]|nr:MAG: NADH-quinone oxidoreductase subunit NuoH [Verrucomicrobiota bacterium]